MLNATAGELIRSSRCRERILWISHFNPKDMKDGKAAFPRELASWAAESEDGSEGRLDSQADVACGFEFNDRDSTN